MWRCGTSPGYKMECAAVDERSDFSVMPQGERVADLGAVDFEEEVVRQQGELGIVNIPNWLAIDTKTGKG